MTLIFDASKRVLRHRIIYLPSAKLPPGNPFLDLLPGEGPELIAFQLALLQHNSRLTSALTLIVDISTKDLASYTAEVLDGEGLDLLTHLSDTDLAAVDLHLASKILKLDHARF